LRSAVRWLSIWGLALSIGSGCAHYHFGNESLFRPEIRTIHVPMIEADTYRRHMAERLYEAVVKEIAHKTPYQLVATPRADSVLTIRLTLESKRIIVLSPTDEGRQVETNLVAQAVWLDRQGAVLAEQSQLPVLPAEAVVAQSGSYFTEAGQSLATAHQAALARLAEQIVALLEVPPLPDR